MITVGICFNNYPPDSCVPPVNWDLLSFILLEVFSHFQGLINWDFNFKPTWVHDTLSLKLFFKQYRKFTFPDYNFYSASVQFSSVIQSCPTLCDPMNCSTPGLPVHHQLPEFTQTHAHRVSDAIQPSHPLSSPSPPAPNPSQHQGLFQ